MPLIVIRTPREKRLWQQAQRQAVQDGQGANGSYILGLYERLRTRVSRAKGREADRRPHQNVEGPLGLKRSTPDMGAVSTERVYNYLRQNYPERVLHWVKKVRWQYKSSVPLKFIHMDRRPGGRNQNKVQRIAEAVRQGKPMEPVVLVSGPHGYWIADGYHRTLAFQHAGRKRIAAYVAEVDSDEGPWRRAMHEAKLNKSYVRKTRETEQGVAMNPQDWDGVADVLLRENGVVEPETEEPQGTSANPQPGYARVYDRRGRPTRRVINPQAHEKPMVYSKRAVLAKAQTPADLTITIPDGLLEAYERAYRQFHDVDPEEEPRWSLRAKGTQGQIWRASDGWGYRYFWCHANGQIDYLGYQMPDVMAYHFEGPLKELAKRQDITRTTFKTKLGFGDRRWDALLRKLIEEKYRASHITKSRHARDSRGLFIRRRGAAHRTRGMNPNPVGRLKPNRPRPSALPGEIGPGHAHPMQESSMQVMHAISASKRRDPRHPDWGFDPLANLPGNTGHPKPVGKPGIFLYKSDPAIRQAVHDYAVLLDAGKSPATALRLVAQRFPWVLAEDNPRARDWWAAVRRADLPRPAAFMGVDTEVDPDVNSRPRPKRAVFWREDLANLGQGIMAPTGSGGAGR